MAVKSQNELNGTKLLQMIRKINDGDEEKHTLMTSARSMKITKEFVGHSLRIFDGQRYRPITITEEMVDQKLREIVNPITTTAKLRYISIPPRKMQVVAALVKGRPIEEALNVLNFTNRVAARHLAKTLKSAAANALSLEGTDALKPEDLFVKSILIDPAPTAKRIRFQSMGRVFRYHKRYCHLTVHLEETEEARLERLEEMRKAKSSGRSRTRSKAKSEAKSDKKKETKKTKTRTKDKAKTKAKPAPREKRSKKADTKSKQSGSTKKQKVI